jgi:MoxR-like ATPase
VHRSLRDAFTAKSNSECGIWYLVSQKNQENKKPQRHRVLSASTPVIARRRTTPSTIEERVNSSTDTAPRNDVEAVKALTSGFRDIKSEIGKVIIGQETVVEHLLIGMLARGHCLLIGVPGLAKTLLIKTLAEVLDLEFSRIQFTPDLMPSDITGTEIIEDNRATGAKGFKFVKGPVFTNILLADEINRTPPKTQAALLEAMQEHHVTAAGQKYVLQEPFFVLATQNPIEQEGTYPLPEAQLDRFMFNLWLDYPSMEEELQIVKSTTSMYKADLRRILNAQQIIAFQDLVRRVPVADNVVAFAVNLVSRTRPSSPSSPQYIKDWLGWGAGPRASQYLILGAKTRAILDGRHSPDIEDVRMVAGPVLRHRLVTNFNAEADGVTSIKIIERLLEND